MSIELGQKYRCRWDGGSRHIVIAIGAHDVILSDCRTGEKTRVTDAQLANEYLPVATSDPIEPDHYRLAPGAPQPVDIAELLSFNLGNVIKYTARAGRKGDALTDLRKAKYYLEREIKRMEAKQP